MKIAGVCRAFEAGRRLAGLGYHQWYPPDPPADVRHDAIADVWDYAVGKVAAQKGMSDRHSYSIAIICSLCVAIVPSSPNF
jgi:hypothetical protein